MNTLLYFQLSAEIFTSGSWLIVTVLLWSLWFRNGETQSREMKCKENFWNHWKKGMALVSLIFFFKIFWCGPFLKSLLNLLQNYLCFMFWFFWPPEACRILAPWTGIEPSPPALESKVLTTRPPGKSWELNMLFFLKTWVVSVTGKACYCIC